MDKVWNLVIDIFIGILIFFISVTIYFGLRTETVMKSLYKNVSEEFVTNTKRNGTLNLEEYEAYMERMGTGNSLFDISFEHRYKIQEPEYRFKTLEEILEEQNNAYDGTNDYHYREVITERPHVDDPINDGNLNTETNESVLENAVDTPADPNHVHDENCYAGHRHVGESLFTHTHQHTSSCVEWEVSRWVYFTCNQCGEKGKNILSSWYWDDVTNSPKLLQSITPLCGSCGSYSISNTSFQSSWAYSCDYPTIDIDGDGYTDAVGRDQAYEYEKAYPQSNDRATYASGCYLYHKSKNLGFDLYNDSSIGIAFNTMMRTDKFQGYCSVPEFITIGISTNRFLNEDADISSMPNLCRITYRAYKSNNGSIRFKFSSYWGVDSSFRPFSGTDNPGFPADISVSQLNTYSMSTSTINNWFYDFFSRNYYSVNNGEITSHLHWFSRVWNSNGHQSWYEDRTVYLDVCDYDHSLGVDKWIHTCGLEEDDTINCDSIITSLTPTHPVQTVYTNEPLITTAEAIFQDGSKKTVVCTTDFSTSIIGSNQEATLTYTSTVGKNNPDKILLGYSTKLNSWDEPSAWYISKDGRTWDKTNVPTGKVKYLNGEFIVISFRNIYTSADGTNWELQNVVYHDTPNDLTGIHIRDIVYGDNGFYYGYGSVTENLGSIHNTVTRGVFLESKDLINWYWVAHHNGWGEQLAINKQGESKSLIAPYYGNREQSLYPGYYTASIDSAGHMKLNTPNSYRGYDYSSEVKQVGNFAVHARGSYTGYYIGAQQVSIPSVYKQYAPSINPFVYGRGMYFAIGTDGYLYKGSEITNLEKIISHNFNSPDYISASVYFDDRIIVSGSRNTQSGSKGVIYTSIDGVNWTEKGGRSFSQLVCNAEGGSGEIVQDNLDNIQINTCIVNVNVIPKNKTCSKGHTYNLNDDGTDPGCPYCWAWVESLRVIHPTSSPIVITIGTALQDNNITLLATYMDGHTEEVSSGYIDNLDSAYLGTKPVTIGYKGASITVIVTTVCATITCDICGYIYQLYPDGTNPGCPRCIQKTPVFTGNIMEYNYIKNTEEILEELYQKRKYSFNVDDVFNIKVNNKSTNIGRKLLRKVYPSLTDRWFTMNKSGHVMSK